jgi:hypothetical protein
LFRESRSHSKQRKTLKQLHSDLAQLGFTGSNDRVLADSLALVLLHNETLAVPAVADSLAVEQPFMQHVLNCLIKLGDVPQPKRTLPSPALTLVNEPVADTDRYYRLRRRALKTLSH